MVLEVCSFTTAYGMDVSAPRGTFTLRPDDGPVVLLSAGVGATPVLAMLHALATEKSERQIWWIYGARNRDDHHAEKPHSPSSGLAVFTAKPWEKHLVNIERHHSICCKLSHKSDITQHPERSTRILYRP